VILGYQDPDLGQYDRSSPTLSRTARHIFLSLAAQYGWALNTWDATSACLMGDLSSRMKPLYVRVPRDLLETLHMPKDMVFKLLKSVYGLAEAPLAWWKTLRKTLMDLGLKSNPMDICLLNLHDQKGQLYGMVGVHVDDLLMAGSGPCWEDMKTAQQKVQVGTA
jgi:hypothetical protein